MAQIWMCPEKKFISHKGGKVFLHILKGEYVPTLFPVVVAKSQCPKLTKNSFKVRLFPLLLQASLRRQVGCRSGLALHFHGNTSPRAQGQQTRACMQLCFAYCSLSFFAATVAGPEHDRATYLFYFALLLLYCVHSLKGFLYLQCFLVLDL